MLAPGFPSERRQMKSYGRRMRERSVGSGAPGRTAMVIWVLLVALTACVSSHVMIGKARPPITPDQVKIYTGPPASRYDEIASLDTSSSGSLSFTAQRKSDKVIERLKGEAAKLGANGVLLESMSDQVSGSFGTGGGSASASGNTAVGVGIGGSVALHRKAGTGIAIYVYADPKIQQ
jgi:hypothetical protein